MTFRWSKPLLVAASIALGLQIALVTSAMAATSAWTQLGAGPFSWNDSLNWTPGVIPNAIADVANFTTAGGPPTQSVTLDIPITIGTLDLTNTATSYTISNGASGNLILDNGGSASVISLISGGLAQTVNADINLAAGVNITNGNAIGGNALTIGGNITGTGPLSKQGTGDLILSGSNSYSGNTFYGPTTGTGAINAGKLILSGGNNRLPATSVLNFHPVSYPVPANNTTYTSALDIGSTSQTLSTIHLPGGGVGVAELPTGAAVTIAGAGGTLKLNGDSFYVGVATMGATLAPAVTHNVNMSTLTNFIFDNATKDVAVHLSGTARVSAATNQVGTLTLAQNNTIDAANILISDVSPGGGAGGGQSTLIFGTGTNIVNIGSAAATGRFNIAFSARSNAIVTLPANGSLTLRGFQGINPLHELFIGNVANSSASTFTDTVNWSAGTVNALVTTMSLASADNTAGGRAGSVTVNFTLGDTTGPEDFTVGTLLIGRITGTNATAVSGILSATGNFTMNNAGGVLNATTISLAENTITAAGTSPVKTVSGIINLQNGTIKATTIQLGTQGGTATTVTRALNWTNGTIENPTSGNTAINNVPIVLSAGTHTFNATGSNTITQNSGSPISGATFGISKTGAGTLILNATNTYTGLTTVSQGTLGGNGTLASVVSLLGGSTISPGTSPGTLTIGGLTISDNSSSIFELNVADTTVGGGINDLIDINGLFDVSGANASTVTVNVVKIGGGNFDGTGTWTLMTYDTLNPGLFNPANILITGMESGYTGTISVVPDTANPLLAGKVQLNVVPEASSFVLMGFGLIGFAGFVRNRRRGMNP